MLASEQLGDVTILPPFPPAKLDAYSALITTCLRRKQTGAPLECHPEIVDSASFPARINDKALLEILDYPIPVGGGTARAFTNAADKQKLVEILIRIATGWRDISIYDASANFNRKLETLGRQRATEQLRIYVDEFTANSVLNTFARVLNEESDTQTLINAIRGIKGLILSRFVLLPNFVTMALTAIQGLASEAEPNVSVRDVARTAQAEIAAKTAPPPAPPTPPPTPAPPPPSKAAAGMSPALVIVPVALATLAGVLLIRRGFTQRGAAASTSFGSHQQSWEQQKTREVSRSYMAAMDWLERVGSWPSSDPAVARITKAAELRVSRRY
jgi:hypothetical protein